MEFTEKAPIEEGFAPVFQDRLAPELERLEETRQTLLAKAKRHAGIALAVAAALSLLSVVYGSGDVWVGPIVLMAFGGLAAWFLWRRQAHRWSGSMAEVVMPPVCDFLGGLSYDRAALDRFPLDRVVSLGLLDEHNRTSLQDRIEGSYRGTGFEMVEAHLRRRTRSAGDDDDDSSEKTVFKGLLFRIDVPEPAPTPILIARDFGSFGNKLNAFFASGRGRNMPRVEVDHPEFEQHFEMHAEDPEAARGYLPPEFLDNLIAIAKHESDEGLAGMTAGFQRDSFYLALARKTDFLELGGLRQPVGEIEGELHEVFEDLAMVRRIIDRLHGDAPEV
ncbi:hypothetical protein DRV85_06930 [Rhodosalinus halophilus]|uniref:DUF3137 domain-containing protein n=1 Tax=Rhodosalinus halophilus TaxID=2259333 RepID=A0A365U8V2_9RHOB|nr:DUF3137 domain-containing protein [Rhodosalinus halophilus]RBI85472.1 hypothetical protein DRV85_06930 [Rhodosalinus halophilus]